MKELFGTTIDSLVYLLPGILSLTAVLYIVAPTLLIKSEGSLGLGQVLIGGAFALVSGLLLLRVSAGVAWILERYYGEPLLIGSIRSFAEEDLIRRQMSVQHAGMNLSDANVYLVAQAAIEELSPRNAEASRRLESIALLCRSLILVVPLVVFAMVSGPDWRTIPRVGHNRRIVRLRVARRRSAKSESGTRTNRRICRSTSRSGARTHFSRPLPLSLASTIAALGRFLPRHSTGPSTRPRIAFTLRVSALSCSFG